MDRERLRAIWKREEAAAHIHGWDFSHIRGRYEAEHDLPWSYEELVRGRLKREMPEGAGLSWKTWRQFGAFAAGQAGEPPEIFIF